MAPLHAPLVARAIHAHSPSHTKQQTPTDKKKGTMRLHFVALFLAVIIGVASTADVRAFSRGSGRGSRSVADCCASDFPHLAHPQTQATADFPTDKPLAGLLSKLDGLEKGEPCPLCPAGSSTPTYCPAMNTTGAAPWVGGCVDLQTGVIVKQRTSDRFKAINCGSCGGRCDVGCPCVNGTCGTGPACVLP